MFQEKLFISIDCDQHASESITYPIVQALLNALEARLPLFRFHSEEVAVLAVGLGKELGWRKKNLEMLEIAALLHDIGKIAIPDVILRKSGTLNSSEWDIIKLHPEYSVQIIEPIVGFKQIFPWIYHHHERWDGTGYPGKIKGNNIPNASRIISIADTYQAITSERVYKRAFTSTEALAEIEACAGKQFDPEIVKVFSTMIRLAIAS